MNYIIHESAITSPVENIREVRPGVVEFTTVLQEADAKNRNGRIYPKDVVDAGIRSPYVQERLRTKTLFGEAGHPQDTNMQRQTTIDPRNLAFLIKEFWWEGNLLKAKCETCSTAIGKDMAGLISENHSLLSFSLRAQGNVQRDNVRDAIVVQSPLMVITYDWVITPSHDKAVMESFSEETQRNMFNFEHYGNRQMALTESLSLFENGSMIKLSEADTAKTEKDYFKTYAKKMKPLNEMYLYEDSDKVTKVTQSFVILENENSIKKVSKEDYLLKMIRSNLSEMVADIDVMAVTAQPETESKDVDVTITTDKVSDTINKADDVTPIENIDAEGCSCGKDCKCKEEEKECEHEHCECHNHPEHKTSEHTVKEAVVEPVSALDLEVAETTDQEDGVADALPDTSAELNYDDEEKDAEVEPIKLDDEDLGIKLDVEEKEGE